MRRILLADATHTLLPWLDLTSRALSASITEVRSAAELEMALEEAGPFDLVVTHIRLGAQSGLQALARARAMSVKTPFVVVMSVHDQLIRVMVSDSSSEILSSRMVDQQNLAALAQGLVRHSSRPRLQEQA